MNELLEIKTKFTQRELIDKFLGMLHSVENDYNQETVSDFEEELEKIQSELCDNCGDNGTFFFTYDNKLEHSQPCGKCNKKTLDVIIIQKRIEDTQQMIDWIEDILLGITDGYFKHNKTQLKHIVDKLQFALQYGEVPPDE